MPDFIAIMRIVASIFSTVFGSLGVFLTYFSFPIPDLRTQAILFITIAIGIEWFAEKQGKTR